MGFLCSKILFLAETVGFEPTYQFPDKRISSASRYDHFGTSPFFCTCRIAQIFQKNNHFCQFICLFCFFEYNIPIGAMYFWQL